MRNSFNKWEVEGKRSTNASLSELKHLSLLSALEIHIPSADILPANFLTHKLKRFNIHIGVTPEELMCETTLNTLKLSLTTSIRSMDEDIKFLVKMSEDLSLDGTEVVSNIIHQLDFENLKHLQLRNNIDFSHIINRKVVFMNLTTLRVHRYVRLEFLFSFSMAVSLVELKHLEISTCHIIKEIVSRREYNDESLRSMDNSRNFFNKLEVLQLYDLPNLVRFCTGSFIEFEALKSLEIVKCHKMGAFIASKEEEWNLNVDLKSGNGIQNFLFDKKVGLPGLEILKINQALKLKTIWHVQLARGDSFCRLRQLQVSVCESLINVFPPSIIGRLNALEMLKIEHCISLEVVFELVRGITVEEPHIASPNDQLKLLCCQDLNSVRIYSCDNLRMIFPTSVARYLHQLNQLSVESCGRVEEIVGEEEEEGVLETVHPYFLFPKVKSVQFEDMPQLKKFYPGIRGSHWPLLKDLKVNGCDKVNTFSSEVLFFQGKHEPDPLAQQSLFLIDKASFPNLEYLELDDMEIWNGPTPAEFFSQLKSMHFNKCSPFSKPASIIFLHNLPNIEVIEVIGCSSEEIFVDYGNSISGSVRLSLPRVRKLKLYGLDNLMHLGGRIKAAVAPLFPSLEILEVELCSRLKNLNSSAISFQNLTTLKVIGCKGLEYLMTYSVAKSFVQLTTMEVRSCERVVVIVGRAGANPGDAAANEITFSRLQRLTLSDLPSLRGFCSSACFVKLPSCRTLIIELCPIELKISPEKFLLNNQRSESRISTRRKIMDELKNPNTMRIGIWGIGGVGKTTLAKEVYKQATADKKLFDDVVLLLDVKSSPNSEEIQKKIVGKLGMDILDNETMEKRASRLRARIKDKKIFVILDDVWKQIDLVAVGLPSLDTCKILLTSRIGKTLSDMNTQKEVLLDILQEQESWDLFKEKAGDVVDDPAIRTVAEQVIKHCGGLSVLIVIMASVLKKITSLSAWKDALTCLKAGSDRGEKLTEQAHLGIKWSYDQLNDKELKPLFLLCGITIQGNYISLEDLLKYGMSLGFLGKAFKVEEARDTLHSWIEKLKDFCLLTDSSDNRYVRMPDLVRDVANQIAFRDENILSLMDEGGVRQMKGWSDSDLLKKCTIMSFPSSKGIPRLPEVMHCPALKMFLLQGDLDADSQKISARFFEEMENLQVLSLRCMTIPSLPPSFQSLKNLDSLCLDKCILGDIALIGELSNLEILSLSESNVTQLPKEVGKLTHLRLLDLSDCSKLEVISPGVISSLGRLEELRMRNSFNKWEVEGERSNASLSELQYLSQLSALDIHIANADILPANLFSHKLKRFNIIVGDAYMWEKPMAETTLNTLKVKLTTSFEELDECLKLLVKRSEDLSLYAEGMNNIVQSLDREDFVHLKHLQLQSNVECNDIVNRKAVFPNLRTLTVHRCDGPSLLFSFSMPESHVELERLEISTCKIMQETLSSAREYSQENIDKVFSKREVLKLNGSPNITRFSSGSIEKLDLEGWVKLGAYDAAMSSNTRVWKEIEETHSEENLNVKSELITMRYFLFDLKVVFRNLTTLTVHRCDHLSFLFSVSMTESLVKLKHLEISTCENIKEIVSSTSEYGKEDMDNVFTELEDLKLDNLPNLTRFCSGSYIDLLSLKKLAIHGCTKLGRFISDNVAKSGEDTIIYEEIEEKDLEGNNSLNPVRYFLFDEKIGLPKLTSLEVQRCDELSFLFSTARSLVQLKHLVISECQIMEVILNEEYIEDIKDKLFPKLEQLTLNNLPYLDRFCSGSCVEFASLEGLHIEKCTKLETFICNSLSNGSASAKEMEDRNADQNIKTVTQDSLFDKKVGFPNLKRLTIINLPKLVSIWHTQLAPDSFCRLQEVTVQQCNSLKTILPDSLIVRVFQQLQKLIVNECGVEEIISQGERLDDEFVFPNLIYLEFRSLFHLKRFYPRMQAFSWPQLKTLVLLDCQKLDILAAEVSGLQKTQDTRILRTPATLLSPAKQPSILINQSSFPKLEDLTLVPMDIWYGQPTSAVCCEKAVFAGISNRHPHGSLPHLRTLRLHGLEKLMRLWENIEPSGKEFPVLEILEVKFCGLNSLELSSLFFWNLTVLEVTFCWRLQYLTTYSGARSLRQLKKLKIDECKRMKEIFAIEGNGEDDSNVEIVFSQLQHLELNDLISLQRVCPSNCIVRVPNLETLEVNWCSIKLKFSSGMLEDESNMHLDLQRSHFSKEALSTTESASSSGKDQKQPATNTSERAERIEFNARELHDDSLTNELNKHGPLLPGISKSEHGVEGEIHGVEDEIQETHINLQNMDHHEVMDLNQKRIVTNTSKNLQDTDFDLQKNLIERLEEELRAKKADIRRLEEELRANPAERRDGLKSQREREVNRASEDAHLCENLTGNTITLRSSPETPSTTSRLGSRTRKVSRQTSRGSFSLETERINSAFDYEALW